MFKPLYIVVLIILIPITSLSAEIDETEKCPQVVNSARSACGYSDGFEIQVSNSCNKNIELHVCVQTNTLDWLCYHNSNLRPHGIVRGYACHSTGKYNIITCKPNENCAPPSQNLSTISE
jgi:hypothetical protein